MTAIIADGARHILTLHQSKAVPWRWWALKYGISQPQGFRNLWRHRRQFRIHCTPVYVERWGDQLEFGVCCGRRTLYVQRHR